jgi:hypothetical protein
LRNNEPNIHNFWPKFQPLFQRCESDFVWMLFQKPFISSNPNFK